MLLLPDPFREKVAQRNFSRDPTALRSRPDIKDGRNSAKDGMVEVGCRVV